MSRPKIKEVTTSNTFASSFLDLAQKSWRPECLIDPILRNLKDADFVNSMDDLEKRTWYSFADVVKNFLGNNRAVNYRELIEKMLKCR